MQCNLPCEMAIEAANFLDDQRRDVVLTMGLELVPQRDSLHSNGGTIWEGVEIKWRDDVRNSGLGSR